LPPYTAHTLPEGAPIPLADQRLSKQNTDTDKQETTAFFPQPARAPRQATPSSARLPALPELAQSHWRSSDFLFFARLGQSSE